MEVAIVIDKDGIERPDNPEEHMMTFGKKLRKVKIDGNYPYRPRNIFFRMWAAFFRSFTISLLCPYFFWSGKVRVTGRQNLKGLRRRAFVVVCNHVTLIDDLSIGTNILNMRKIYFTTLQQNIQHKATGFWLRSLGGIPIPVGSVAGMRKFDEDLSYLLQHKKPIIYNPETALWPKYRGVRPFKRGAFVTAVKNDVPVLPVAITMKRKQKKNGKYRYRYIFNILPLIYADKSLTQKEASEKLLNETHSIIEKTVQEYYQNNECGFEDEKTLKTK